MAGKCALARERLARTVARMRQAGGLEKGVSLIKTGFLGQAVTVMKNFGGNAIALGYRTLAEHPMRAGVDYVLSVGRSAIDGKITLSPDAYRQVVLSLDADGLGHFAKGFAEGTKPTIEAIKAAGTAARGASGVMGKIRAAVVAFGDELNTRLNAEQVNRTLDYKELRYENPVTDAIVNSVMGLMEAGDRPFWRAQHDFSLYAQSKMLAAAEGLKGDALTQRGARLFEHPTDEMTFRAVTDANYTTFKNKNFLSRMASNVKRGAASIAEKEPTAPKGTARYGVEKTAQMGGKVGSYALETNLPFTGVPSSVAGQAFGLASGPAGLLRLLVNRDPAMTSRIISDAALGSTLMAWGYQLARQGKINGARPTNPAEAAQFDAEGRQAWSVKLGNKWYDMRFSVPIGAPLYAGAALANAKQNDPNASVSDRLVTGVGATAKMMTQQTYLQNVSVLIDALSAPEKKGARFVASQVPIPSVLGQVARATDPNERKPEGIGGMLAAKVPGLSRINPISVDALGRPQTRTIPERLSEVASPSRIKESTETPVTKEFARLGISLTLPGSSSSIAGETFSRGGKAQSDYLQKVGTAKDEYLTKYIASDAYQKLPDDEKAIALLKVQTAVQSHFSKLFAGEEAQKGTEPERKSRRRRASETSALTVPGGPSDARIEFQYDKDGRITGATLKRPKQNA